MPKLTRGIRNFVNVVESYTTSLSHDHPTSRAFRAYSFAAVLSVGPAILPFLISSKVRSRGFKRLWSILTRELGPTGFAFSMAVAVGGGGYLQVLSKQLEGHLRSSQQESGTFQVAEEGTNPKQRDWTDWLKDWIPSLSEVHRAFILNSIACMVAIGLLQRRKRHFRPSATDIPMTLPVDDASAKRGTSQTWDLTLLLFVRAVDSLIHGAIHNTVARTEDGEINKKEKDSTTTTTIVKQRLFSHLDAFLFSVCSARIIWCFFYQPERLPPSYVKWISRLADIDPRIPSALRSFRNHSFSYVNGYAASKELAAFAEYLGYPSSWGDPAYVPAYGKTADAIWAQLGVQGRNGRGGVPCELVHGGNGAGKSCLKNVTIRGSKAWIAALAIYLPVHLLPIAIKRPRDLLHLKKLVHPFLGVLRSATFLSSFVSLMWLGVCTTRTLVLARLFPFISHDYFDGPYGCIYIASLLCGSSIWIEHQRRRGEIALYVLPRAIRTCLSDSWLRSGGKQVQILERLVFTLSLATLLTKAIYHQSSLRGLSRFTLDFIMNGSSGTLRKRKQSSTNDNIA